MHVQSCCFANLNLLLSVVLVDVAVVVAFKSFLLRNENITLACSCIQCNVHIVSNSMLLEIDRTPNF